MDAQAFRTQAMPVTQAHRTFDKLFGIGAGKTGTTTLSVIMHLLGLRVAPQVDGELFGRQASRGALDALRRYVEAHDAFQDYPFSTGLTFAQVDALFPRSKFILTHRPADEWFRSLTRFHSKVVNGRAEAARPTEEQLRARDRLYPGYTADRWSTSWLHVVDEDLSPRVDWDLAYDREHFIARYEQRNATVVRHFAERPDDLLVIDLTRETDTSRIVEFLGLPGSLVTDVPHANRT